MDLIVFYLLCIAGWQCFEKLKLPTPTILGPLVVISMASFFGMNMAIPIWVKPVLSTLMGMIMGLRFNVKLKGMIKEILLVAGWIITASWVTARLLVFLGLTKETALFSALPGGIVEVSLIAMSFDADTFVVALLHSSRLFATMLIIPFLAKRACKESTCIAVEGELSAKREWLAIIIVSIVSSVLLTLTGMPASNLLGPMLGVGLYIRVRDIKLEVNRNFQNYVQIGVGGLIGLTATRESILGIPDYLIPIICLNIMLLGSSLLLGFILHKTTAWDLTTCFLATAPAGLTPIVILAMELEADSGRVAVFQILRLATVVLFAPLEGYIFLSG